MRTFTRRTPRPVRPTFRRVAVHILLGTCLGLVVAGVFGAVLKLLWNYVMPGLFHLPSIGFCQAVALLVLARLLTGRFGHGRHGRHWLHSHGERRDGAPSQEGYERWWRHRNDPPVEDRP